MINDKKHLKKSKKCCIIYRNKLINMKGVGTLTEIKNDLAPFLFHQGTNYSAYEYMGAHVKDGKVCFRVWAPNAVALYVTGEYCNWGIGERMERITDGGIWESELDYELFEKKPMYKYRILSQGG